VLGVEPDEVLVVALDEERLPWGRAALREPRWEIAGAVVLLGRLVDAVHVGPDTEVADVEHPLEAHAERRLEREDVLVHAVHGPMDVARGADQHLTAMTLPARWLDSAAGRPAG
jgi:hypothetical protein